VSRLAHPLLPITRAAAVLTAVLAGSCVWWPDIADRPDVEVGPTLDRTMVVPPADQIVDLTTISTQFSVAGAVTDPDTSAEALDYQWYVGYLESSTPRRPAFTGQPSILFDPCFFQSELIPFQAPHVLELFVSDHTIEFDPEQGRIITGGYAYVSWTFVPQVACPTTGGGQ